jgi:two-component system chemotaxis response regulator CheB
MLAEFLNSAPDIQVVGTAIRGKEAIILNRKLRPDLITMDLRMPGLDGFATIEEIMTTHPVPILVVTSAPIRNGVDQSIRALAAGALDIIQKPYLHGKDVESMCEKVRILASVHVTRRKRPQRRRNLINRTRLAGRQPAVIAIAASMGGPNLLSDILAELPREFPSCVLVTQHLPEGHSREFALWLNDILTVDVVEARDKERIWPGRVILAPSDRHLVVTFPGMMSVSDEPPVNNHRPSATVMFRSVARAYGQAAFGIVLSGMGNDGAEGLLELRQAGGLCYAQDEESAVAFGMPRSAIEIGAVDEILSTEAIKELLLCCAGETE